MFTGRVIGVVWATRKDERLHGVRLLVVEPVRSDGKAAGKPLVVADRVGAGPGEVVLLARSRDASMVVNEAPVDAAVIGIVDRMDASPAPAADLAAQGFLIDRGGRAL